GWPAGGPDGHAGECRACRHRCLAGRLSLGRAAPAALDCPADRGQAPALAAGRAGHGARCRRPGDAGRSHAGAPCERRPDRRRRPRPDRAGAGGGAEAWGEPMTALNALLVRDMRLAVRVGGGALIGVLFFLLVVAIIPFAIGPDLALLARIGPAILWLGALLASLLGLDRLIASDFEDGSLDLILTARMPLEVTVAAKAVAHWLTTGL